MQNGWQIWRKKFYRSVPRIFILCSLIKTPYLSHTKNSHLTKLTLSLSLKYNRSNIEHIITLTEGKVSLYSSTPVYFVWIGCFVKWNEQQFKIEKVETKFVKLKPSKRQNSKEDTWSKQKFFTRVAKWKRWNLPQTFEKKQCCMVYSRHIFDLKFQS